MKPGRKPLPVPVREDILYLLECGLSLRQISHLTGVGKTTVARIRDEQQAP